MSQRQDSSQSNEGKTKENGQLTRKSQTSISKVRSVDQGSKELDPKRTTWKLKRTPGPKNRLSERNNAGRAERPCQRGTTWRRDAMNAGCRLEEPSGTVTRTHRSGRTAATHPGTGPWHQGKRTGRSVGTNGQSPRQGCQGCSQIGRSGFLAVLGSSLWTELCWVPTAALWTAQQTHLKKLLRASQD